MTLGNLQQLISDIEPYEPIKAKYNGTTEIRTNGKERMWVGINNYQSVDLTIKLYNTEALDGIDRPNPLKPFSVLSKVRSRRKGS